MESWIGIQTPDETVSLRTNTLTKGMTLSLLSQ